jgi:hypothetical protein
VASLLAVAVPPLVAGITGDRFYEPAAMTDGFHMAMFACAGLAAAGEIVAWFTISDDALQADPLLLGAKPVPVSTHYSCPVAGPPLRTPDARPVPAAGSPTGRPSSRPQ